MESYTDLSELELRKSILARQDTLGSYGQPYVGGSALHDRLGSKSAPPGGRDYFRRLTIDRSKTVSRRSSRTGPRSRPDTALTSSTTVTNVNPEFTTIRPITAVTSGRTSTVRPFISRESVLNFSNVDDLENVDCDHDNNKSRFPKEGIEKSRHVYLAACRKLKIVPSSSFLRLIGSRNIRLNHQSLTPRAIRPIAIALATGMVVTELHLAHNDIRDDGLRCVVDMLRDNATVHVLDVSHNNLRSAGAAMLGHLLIENDALLVLRASGNRFKAVDTSYFTDALLKNNSLRTLDLSHNQIRDDGGTTFGKCLVVNSSLETLDLSWNHLRSGGVAGLMHGLKANSTLHTLDLSWNGLGMEGARVLGKTLATNTGLTELAVRACRIDVQALAEFLKHMKKNTTLQTLKLDNNPITYQGARLLVEFLRDHPSMALQTVEMTDVIVSGDFPLLVDNLQVTRPHFRVMHAGILGGKEAILRDLRAPKVKVRDPFVVLMEYAVRQEKRLVDLFSHMDTKNRRCISRHDFRQVVKQETDIQLDARQIHRLEEMLDTECTGDIDFVDLIDSENKYLNADRTRTRSGKASDGRISTGWSRVSVSTGEKENDPET